MPDHAEAALVRMKRLRQCGPVRQPRLGAQIRLRPPMEILAVASSRAANCQSSNVRSQRRAVAMTKVARRFARVRVGCGVRLHARPNKTGGQYPTVQRIESQTKHFRVR